MYVRDLCPVVRYTDRLDKAKKDVTYIFIFSLEIELERAVGKLVGYHADLDSTMHINNLFKYVRIF